ncbi:MAG: peroxidase-related enzyme [Jatrophihabitans sp.]
MARAAWFFPIPGESELPERLQGLFAKARETVGFVPNVFRNYSYRPERFSAWFGHYKLLHEPSEHLDEADREMIAVVVSAWNRCTYCIVSHGHALRKALGGTPDAEATADYIATNWRHAGLDERRSAICAYAEKLTARPHELTEADLLTLRAVGLSDHEVWDVAEIASMYNFTNRMALATGQQPNPEYHWLDRGPDA